MKPTEVYASNHAVSAASDQMKEHIDKLRQAGLIDAEQAKHRIASVEEIRALTSADVCLNMVDSELSRARAAEQNKRAIERKWKKGEPKGKTRQRRNG
jgi:hypothetical protein